MVLAAAGTAESYNTKIDWAPMLDHWADKRAGICTSVTADNKAAFLAEIEEAATAGVDVIELRLDFLKDFSPREDLLPLMAACKNVPYIITYRPAWEG